MGRFLVFLALALAMLPLATCGGGGGAVPTVLPAPVVAPGACDQPAPASTLTASVKDPAFAARGDGVTDDTAAIQKAIDFVAGSGGTLVVPGGTYMVDAITSLQLKSGMTLQLAADAVLKAIPNSARTYSVVTVDGASSVTIQGGTIQGDYGTPVTHTGTGGEWGMGLTLSGCVNVGVFGVTARDCWGDGFYVENGASRILICSVVAVHNRRNGLSLIGADTVAVRNSTFTNSGGTLPEDGIDIEPNAGTTVNNVVITGCTITGNAGDGISDGVDLTLTGTAFITNVTVDGNSINGNGAHTLDSVARSGIELSNSSGHAITNNIVSGNTGNGIELRNNAIGMTLTGNTVQNNSMHGIWDTVGGNAISGNLVSGNGSVP